jgi:hypothetical protein
MTREEFEALLRMEGQWLEVIPVPASSRTYRKWSPTWIAAVKENLSLEDYEDIHRLMRRVNPDWCGVQYEDEKEMVVRTARGATNHQAVKYLINDYLERVQTRADN